MKSLNPSPENCRRSGAIGLGLVPGHGPSSISIRVSHGHNQYEVAVPSDSSFGYLKSVISQGLGLKPEACKLFFGGIEKQDDESLQTAGLKNNSEVLLVEVTSCGQQVPEEVQENPPVSKGEDAVAEVRKEVDKLEPQVSALQAIIDNGNKVDGKEIIYLTEMLMRQLLKLDGIDAEGEGKVKRKSEVRRVQSLVDTLDTLKSRNSNSISNTQKNVSAATEWRAFDSSPSTAPPVVTSPPSPTPSPSSAPPVLPSSSLTPTPLPSSDPPVVPSSSPSPTHTHLPSSSPSPMPSSSTYPVPYLTPSNMPPHSYSAVPHQFTPSNMSPHTFSAVPHQFMPSALPSSNFPGMPYPAPSPMPYYTPSTHHPFQYYDPSQMTYFAPPPVPLSTPTPIPYHAPPHTHSSNPFDMPPSTNVTENWEHFG
ncbi:hypothetical protein C2S53_010818 [Perilla frutescens var. hirtella]|uniref:BAG family molecular chaperone regulator 4 n=1 Tax=Perilla frutescens var. hirtella TaxID=608512 RepID=A0AAD4J026_PERFH|nr:hypothetical protein C2S53_010818 [Perilla frutescens var. hirtella]